MRIKPGRWKRRLIRRPRGWRIGAATATLAALSLTTYLLGWLVLSGGLLLVGFLLEIASYVSSYYETDYQRLKEAARSRAREMN
jgi:hypothetical protein